MDALKRLQASVARATAASKFPPLSTAQQNMNQTEGAISLMMRLPGPYAKDQEPIFYVSIRSATLFDGWGEEWTSQTSAIDAIETAISDIEHLLQKNS